MTTLQFYKTILFAVFCLLAKPSNTQEPLPVIPDSNKIVVMTKFVESIKTITPVSLDSVLQSSLQKRFVPLPDKSVIFSGYDPYFYWFRFHITNRDTIPRQYHILMGPTGQRYAELFQSNSGKWISCGKTGNQYLFSERPYLYTHYVFPLTLHPSATDTFYMSIDASHNFKTFAFSLVPPKTLKKMENRVYLLFGILIGILLLFGVLNIYLFFSIKEKIHLWYSMYIMFLIFLVMKNEGLDEQFLGNDSETGYRLTPIMGIGAITIFLLMHVTQLFLNNISKKHILYRVTSFIKINLLLAAVIHFIVFYVRPDYKIETLVFEWANRSTVIGVVMILTNCIYSLAKGFKPALFILSGTVIFLLGSMERLLVMSTPTYLFPPSLFQIGMVIEVAVISFGLMYRYNLRTPCLSQFVLRWF